MEATVKMFRITGNGLEPLHKIHSLPIGTRVYAYGAGNSESVWCTISEMDTNGNHKLVKVSKQYDEDYFSSPFHTLESHAQPISKKFGIGFYYDISHTFSPDEIAKAIQRAEETTVRHIAEATAKAEADRIELEALPWKFPHLTVIKNKYEERATIKKNLVAHLKKTFPGVKFSVTKHSYDAMDVSWINGPSRREVEKVTGMFEDHVNDASGDFRDYSPSLFNTVFGGYKYIFESREVTEDIYDALNKQGYTREEVNRTIYKTDIPAQYSSVDILDGQIIFI